MAGDAPIASGRDMHFASLSQGEHGSEFSGLAAPAAYHAGDGGGGGGGKGSKHGKGAGKQQGGGKETGIKHKQPFLMSGNSYITDHRGWDICNDFNKGSCHSTGNSPKCPKSDTRTHACSACGKAGHTSSECKSNNANNDSNHTWVPKNKKKRTGGGKATGYNQWKR